MRIVDVGVERVTILVGVVGTDRPARLHVLGMNAGDDVALPHDMGGLRKGRIGSGPIAVLHGVGDVVRVLVPHSRRIRPGRLGRRGHRRQRFIVDRNQLGRILRLHQGFGDHHRYGIADVANAVDHQCRPLGREHRRTVSLFRGITALGMLRPSAL